MKKTLELQTFSSLKEYFLINLHELNHQLRRPLPESAIIYSSGLMEKFSVSDKLFDIKDGKVSDKILGMNYLDATCEEAQNKKRLYKDVADTALFVVGYFSGSLDSKIVDSTYYVNIGKMAYSNLNTEVPSYMGVDGFFDFVAIYFEMLSSLISKVAMNDQSDPMEHMLVNIDSYSDEELFLNGVSKNQTKIVS